MKSEELNKTNQNITKKKETCRTPICVELRSPLLCRWSMCARERICLCEREKKERASWMLWSRRSAWEEKKSEDCSRRRAKEEKKKRKVKIEKRERTNKFGMLRQKGVGICVYRFKFSRILCLAVQDERK